MTGTPLAKQIAEALRPRNLNAYVLAENAADEAGSVAAAVAERAGYVQVDAPETRDRIIQGLEGAHVIHRSDGQRSFADTPMYDEACAIADAVLAALKGDTE